MYKIFNDVDKTFVINLVNDTYRKDHVIKEFNKKCDNYEFIKAISHDSNEVKNLYKTNRVMAFPPCFRCNQEKCSHSNNYLTPKQVGNFLSFKKIMEIIVNNDYSNVLIFEDDFKFAFRSKISFKNLYKFIYQKQLLTTNCPLLIRIGSHTVVNKKYYLKLLLLRKSTFIENNLENMANPCFLINNEYAKLFLKKFNLINTTSDNFIHRKIVEENNVINFSIYPFPVTQLSYGKKNNLFKSTITSNPINNDFSNLNKVASEDEYKNLKSNWLQN